MFKQQKDHNPSQCALTVGFIWQYSGKVAEHVCVHKVCSGGSSHET